MSSRLRPQDRGALHSTAARNNADWCAAVCRTHGLVGVVADMAWTSAHRTPPYYPDAVTLHAEATAIDVLARIDTTAPHGSVKDSFATLDLAPAGFVILFDAEWIHRPAGVPVRSAPDLRVEQVRAADRLVDWQIAWHGANDPPDIFRPALLDDPTVRIVAIREGDHLVGGGALNFGAGMIGVTNVFAIGEVTPAAVWSCLLAAATDYFPDTPIVGYGRPDDLAPALQIGFVVVGPLRVWMGA